MNVCIIALLTTFLTFSNSYIFVKNINSKYPISRPHYDNSIKRIENANQPFQPNNDNNNQTTFTKKKHPISRNHHEKYIKRLNSKNQTTQDLGILGEDDDYFKNLFQEIRIDISGFLKNYY